MKNKTEDLVLPILISALLSKDLLAAPLTLNPKPQNLQTAPPVGKIISRGLYHGSPESQTRPSTDPYLKFFREFFFTYFECLFSEISAQEPLADAFSYQHLLYEQILVEDQPQTLTELYLLFSQGCLIVFSITLRFQLIEIPIAPVIALDWVILGIVDIATVDYLLPPVILLIFESFVQQEFLFFAKKKYLPLHHRTFLAQGAYRPIAPRSSAGAPAL